MKNPVVHFEIVGKDHEALQAYYRNLFEWEIRNVAPEMPYGIIEAGEGELGIGGGVGASSTGTPHATFYVQVEDIEAALAKAVELGGEEVVPVTTIPGMVTFALFSDPEGNRVGLVSAHVPEGGETE